MKKLILLLISVMMLAGTALAYQYCQTDYKCFRDCRARGYSYGYCDNLCSWCKEW